MLNKIYFAEIQKHLKLLTGNFCLPVTIFKCKADCKIGAIVLLYILQFNFKFGFRWRNSRLPLFYLFVIAIGILNWFLLAGFNESNYTVSFLTGLFFWTLCILAIHQIKLFVERNPAVVIHKTILIFFLLNAIFSSLFS